MKRLILYIILFFSFLMVSAQEIPFFRVCLEYGKMDYDFEVDSMNTEVFEGTNFGYYSFKYIYYIDSSNRIEITNLLEQVTVYEHFENNFLKSKGELIKNKLDFEVIDTNDINMSEYRNEGVIINLDTTYSLTPNGYWEIYNNDGTKETGYFLDGKKSGTWYTYYQRFDLTDMHMSLKTYKNDTITSIVCNNFVLDDKDLLLNKWFYVGIPREINDTVGISVYSVKRFDSSLRGREYIEFCDDNTFLNLNYSTCGNSSFTKRSKNEIKWFINDNNRLIIGEQENSIKLLTDKYLILTYSKKK